MVSQSGSIVFQLSSARVRPSTSAASRFEEKLHSSSVTNRDGTTTRPEATHMVLSSLASLQKTGTAQVFICSRISLMRSLRWQCRHAVGRALKRWQWAWKKWYWPSVLWHCRNVPCVRPWSRWTQKKQGTIQYRPTIGLRDYSKQVDPITRNIIVR